MEYTCRTCDLPFERPDSWKRLPNGIQPQCIPCRDAGPSTPTRCGYCGEVFARPDWWKPLRVESLACCQSAECRAAQSALRVAKYRKDAKADRIANNKGGHKKRHGGGPIYTAPAVGQNADGSYYLLPDQPEGVNPKYLR